MKVTRLSDVDPDVKRSVAVGTFDGVHLGHREVIEGSDSVLTSILTRSRWSPRSTPPSS